MQGYRYEFLEELLRISKKKTTHSDFFMLKRKKYKIYIKKP